MEELGLQDPAAARRLRDSGVVPLASGMDPTARSATLAICLKLVLPCWQDDKPGGSGEIRRYGLTPICVDISEALELIRHGLDGLLVPIGNVHPLQLAVQLLV